MLTGEIKMNKFSKAKYLSYMSMLLTLIIVLSIFESMLPPFPLLPPGVKVGLANIVTMYTLFFLGKKEAFSLNIAKGIFVLITRGFTSGLLSICGGLLSICIIIVLASVFKKNISYFLLSIAGAIFHNIGQLIAIYFILNNKYTVYYLPVLIVSGVVMGSITGILLKTLLPVLSYPLKETIK